MKSFEIINRPVAKGQNFEMVTIKEGMKALVATLDGTFEGIVKTTQRKGGFMVDNSFVNYGSVLRIDAI